MFQWFSSKRNVVVTAVVAILVLALSLVGYDSCSVRDRERAATADALAKIQAEHLKELDYAEARTADAAKAVEELEKVNSGLAGEIRGLQAKLHVQVAQTAHGETEGPATLQCPDPTVVSTHEYLPVQVTLKSATDVAEVRAADGKLFFKGTTRTTVLDGLDKTVMLDKAQEWKAEKSFVVETKPGPQELRPAFWTLGAGAQFVAGRDGSGWGPALVVGYHAKERRIGNVALRGWGLAGTVGYAKGGLETTLAATKDFDVKGTQGDR